MIKRKLLKEIGRIEKGNKKRKQLLFNFISLSCPVTEDGKFGASNLTNALNFSTLLQRKPVSSKPQSSHHLVNKKAREPTRYIDLV